MSEITQTLSSFDETKKAGLTRFECLFLSRKIYRYSYNVAPLSSPANSSKVHFKILHNISVSLGISLGVLTPFSQLLTVRSVFPNPNKDSKGNGQKEYNPEVEFEYLAEDIWSEIDRQGNEYVAYTKDVLEALEDEDSESDSNGE